MKKKRDKKYCPKPVTTHGGLIAIARVHARAEEASPLRDDQLTDLGVAYWVSLENLRTGPATEEAWCCVVCALNIGMVLCEQEIGPEYVEDLVKALDGAFRAKIRSQNSGNFRLDGNAMRDIEIGLAIHDEQMRIATRSEVTRAMNSVHARMEAGNIYEVPA